MTDPSTKDMLFTDPQFLKEGFQFTSDVARVFDDMARRSIPLYPHLQEMITQLARHHAQPNTVIYDLGCSTGTTLQQLLPLITSHKVGLKGIDSSPEMIQKATQKLSGKALSDGALFLITQDLTKEYPWEKSSVIILNLVLQFLPILSRKPLLKALKSALVPKGILILVEKIYPNTPSFDPIFTDCYHHYKQTMGYAPQEIENKKMALKTSLHPLTPAQNIDLLHESGFDEVETFFQWFNFMGIVAK